VVAIAQTINSAPLGHVAKLETLNTDFPESDPSRSPDSDLVFVPEFLALAQVLWFRMTVNYMVKEPYRSRNFTHLSRKRAWENLQEIRWVLKDIAYMDLPPPARKTIDLEADWLRPACGKL